MRILGVVKRRVLKETASGEVSERNMAGDGLLSLLVGSDRLRCDDPTSTLSPEITPDVGVCESQGEHLEAAAVAVIEVAV